MAAKKPASKAALPYDKKLVTAWKNVAQKALSGRYASLREVHGQPGTSEALGAAYDAGKFPAEAIWRLGSDAADLAPARMALPVLTSRPHTRASLFFEYHLVATLLGRALREDPSALDAFAAGATGIDRDLADVARAEAGGATPTAETREALAREWVTHNADFPALAVVDGVLTRVRLPVEARREALSTAARRVLGDDFVEVLARALRERLASHAGRDGAPDAYALSTSLDALRLAAPAMGLDEVCGFSLSFFDLWEYCAARAVDDAVRAADIVADRGRPGASLRANALAVVAVARDPSAAPRVERHLRLDDLSHQASPTAAYALEVLLRAPEAWRRHFALDVALAPDAPWSVFRTPIALVLLASVDAEAAERVAVERGDHLDTTRVLGVPPALLLPMLDRAGPTLSRLLLTPILAGYREPASNPPEWLDGRVAFEGTPRDSWIVGYFRAISEARAVAILRRAIVEGHGDHARAALAVHTQFADVVAAAESASE